MPTARSFLAAGHINQSIILAVGGVQGGRDLDTVEAYNYTTDTWATKASMPTARANLAVGVINGILYAVGGNQNGSGALNTVEAYDLSTDTWTTKSPMLTARSGPAVGVIRDKNNRVLLYAVGGKDANGNFLSSVEVYNPGKNTWSAKASMPTARSGLAVGVVNGILYAIGGQNAGGTLATNEAYNPARNTWIAEPPMLTPSYGLAALSVNNGYQGQLWAFGGNDDNGRFFSAVEVYHPAFISWIIRPSMPTARTGLAVSVNNSRDAFYAIGGSNGVDLNTVESFHL
jgi:N-acetylneuraminic acid mutarotase